MSRQVLIVDDSTFIRKQIADTLSDAGYNVLAQVSNGEAAIDQAMELTPDLITLDNVLPDMSGLDVLRVLREKKLEAKVIIISSVGLQSSIQEAIDLGADEYLIKPYTPEKLLEALSKIFK